MAARNRVTRVYLLLSPLLFFFFFAPTLGVGAEEPSGPLGRLAQQRNTWQGEWPDVDQDRWTEQSERINGLRFDIEGERFEAVPGTAWNIAGGVEHGAEALEESIVIEVFSPVREDYLG